MRFTGERVLPDLPELRATYLQSKAAYGFARELVRNARVLDVGAGEGYGPALLIETASEVVSLDSSIEAASFAAGKYGSSERLAFMVGDATRLPFAPGSFDIVCCFQVIEHLDDAPGFLFEANRVLRPGGRLILTTPNRFWAGTGPNPHHVLEYSRDELQELLEIVFSEVEMLGVFGSSRVVRYRARNRSIVNNILKLDVLGLRYRLPERVREPIHAWLTRAIRRFVRQRNPAAVDDLTLGDFPVLNEDIERSIDLLAIARKAETVTGTLN